MMRDRQEKKQPTRWDSQFEGRPLARPDEEIVDQGLAFDLGTLLSRRQALTVLGISALGLSAARVWAEGNSGSSSLPEIPEETAGPFPADGSNRPDVLEQSGIVRSDIRSSLGKAGGTAKGVPMDLELTVTDLAKGGVPFAGVAVYVWHCTSDGRYSLYSRGVRDENFLRGVQIADAEGKVHFTSIFPGCYRGRWPHVHFEVFPDRQSIEDSSNAIATSQLALPRDVCETVYARKGYGYSAHYLSRLSLERDGVFRDDGAAHQLATVTGSVKDGYEASLVVPVDTTTKPGRGFGGFFRRRGRPRRRGRN